MAMLTQTDLHHLRAAEGWLELGNWREANDELENVAAEARALPEVLAVRWQVYAAAKQWEAALEIASALLRMRPDDELGWIHRSYSLHEMKRTQEARDNLLRVAERFPASSTMRYNLACYECRLGRLEEARSWLKKAFEIGDARRLKLQALDDPDLKEMWTA